MIEWLPKQGNFQAIGQGNHIESATHYIPIS